MLAPCWAHVGPMLEAVGGILERSWSDVELILRPFLVNIEQKMKGRGWILEKPLKNIVFLFVFLSSRGSKMRPLGGAFGSSWRSWSDLGGLLGALGTSWRRLDGVLGRLGVLGNAKERLTMCPVGGKLTWLGVPKRVRTKLYDSLQSTDYFLIP